MSKILVLDDDALRLKQFRAGLIGHDVDLVTTSKEAIARIKENDYGIIFLDHDLGGKVYVKSGENTGYEVAQFLSRHADRIKGRVIVHSFNPVGAKNMCRELPCAVHVPGVWMKLGIFAPERASALNAAFNASLRSEPVCDNCQTGVDSPDACDHKGNCGPVGFVRKKGKENV